MEPKNVRLNVVNTMTPKEMDETVMADDERRQILSMTDHTKASKWIRKNQYLNNNLER